MSYQMIRQAIIEKKAVHGMYNGQLREMCPHVIGTKFGKPQALFYQFAGQSNSRPIQPDGSPENWRCIEIAKLLNVSIHESAWHTAPDHSRPQRCVGLTEIDVEITY